jgi:hypothetical protein
MTERFPTEEGLTHGVLLELANITLFTVSSDT